ncbi:MAG: septation regulator SpoVG [Candidatus Omnitrophica bacterium]|nr:septation regulator SpoVG [Candidatus Omnitrophota bacterium]MCA9418385.1 septation regulator SpoVG [Candidatus Omnitrophota bacterium]MCA9424963.1 septation regulator SpoVG [Candidatus Omnitrophota bacterium]MCA9432359.1 septation regulator SpoVG [Candidatus Omnitrophota bacterium]MCA9437720.1 septation regulator SpoVG [Candidatus Omnitrophota bacterium]
MEITEVRVYPVNQNDDRLLAFATITFEHAFVVRDLRIIRGKNGLFVAMPSRKRHDGTYSDVAHPLGQDLRSQIEEKVIGEFNAVTMQNDDAVEMPATSASSETASESVGKQEPTPEKIAV